MRNDDRPLGAPDEPLCIEIPAPTGAIRPAGETTHYGRHANRHANRATRHDTATADPSYTCPTCKTPNALSRFERSRGYHCWKCTRKAEGEIFE